MASSKPDMYDKEIKDQFCIFCYRLTSRLIDIVERKEHIHNSSPQLTTISQAVLTLSYIFRVKYRHAYLNVRSSIIERKQFSVFCKNHFQYEDLPYLFTFLLNISFKFEMFMYLKNEGKNYYGVLAHSLGYFSDSLQFELDGGVEKLCCISRYFLDITKDLEILVNFEDPCRNKLISFEESINEIKAKHLKLFNEKSFMLLKAISNDLYSGLQKYLGEPVLPFLILRFLLEGKVPDCATDDKSLNLVNDSGATIIRYFSRCLIPEIISGIAYGGKSRSQLHLLLGLDDKFEYHITLNAHLLENDSKRKKISSVKGLPILNSFPKGKNFMGIKNDTDICKKGNKQNQKKKSEEFNSNLLDSEFSSLENVHSPEDKSYGNGLEWLKRFDAKTVSLLKTDNAKDNSSENNSVPLVQSTSEVSSSVKQKKLPTKSLPTEVNQVNESKKKGRKKRKKKLQRVEKSESDDASFNFTEKSDPIKQLKDNLIIAVNHTKNLHYWEKKCLIFFMDKAEEFSMLEKLALCKKIETIPNVELEDDANIMQMVDLIKLEEKIDLLYVEDKSENKHFCMKMPFPECTENVRDEFIELMFKLLAISLGKTFQAAMLGEWVPFLQNILEKDESLLSQIINCGPNDFLQFLSDHASKEDVP